MTRAKDEIPAGLIQAAASAARRSARLGADPPRGAALVTRRGHIYAAPELAGPEGTGASAERAALYLARMEDRSPIVRIVLRGGRSGRSDAGRPSGASLQVLLELAPKARIHWGTDRRPRGGTNASSLLAGAFEPDHLDRDA